MLVDPDDAGWSAEELRLFLAERDIEARPLWKPMHLQPVYAEAPAYVNGSSEALFERGLSLPSGSVLTDEQFGRVVDAVDEFVQARR